MSYGELQSVKIERKKEKERLRNNALNGHEIELKSTQVTCVCVFSGLEELKYVSK